MAENANPYDNLEVRSYFLNVRTGDSSIHLLIEKENNVKKILSSLLIDGGIKSASLNVGNAIRAIPEIEDKEGFRFTAIAVTHFHNDHATGLFDLLKKDWNNNKGQQSNYVTSDTVLYCPLTGIEKRFRDQYHIRLNMTDNPTSYHLQFRLSPKHRWENICRAMPSIHALGYDMFSNTHYDRKIFSIENTQHYPVSLGMVDTSCLSDVRTTKPIFLVYGIDNVRLNSDEWKILPDHMRKAGQAQQVMNDSSVMALVMWPTSRRPGEKRRISLYVGGDIDIDNEKEMLGWLDNGGSIHQINTTYTLDVVKASHHGADTSTPERFFIQNSQYIILSAGTRHGHPTFAFLYVFFALVNALEKREMEPPQILATTFPYWLLKHPANLGSNDLTAGTIMDWADTAIDVHKNFVEIEKLLNNGTGLLTRYLNEKFQQYTLYLAAAKAFYDFESKGMQEEGKSFKDEVIDQYPDHPMSQVYGDMINERVWDDYTQYYRHCKQNSDNDVALGVQETIKLLWASQKISPSYTKDSNAWISTVAFGNSPKIETDVSPDPSLVAIVPKKIAPVKVPRKQKVSVNTNSNIQDFSKKIRKFSTSRRKGILNKYSGDVQSIASSSVSLPGGFDSLEAWIKWLLVQDLSLESLKSETKFEKQFDEAESACAKWFGGSLSGKVCLRLLGTGNNEHVSLDQVDVQLDIKNGSLIATDDAFQPSLVFSTRKEAQQIQFGQDAVNSLSPFGYCEALNGVVFALDLSASPKVPAPFTLIQFAELIGFPISEGILSGLLKTIMLEPYTGTRDVPTRSALWFMPQFSSRTILRIQMRLVAGSQDLGDVLSKGLGPLGLENVTFIGFSHTEDLGPENTETIAQLGIQAIVEWKASVGDGTHKPPSPIGKVGITLSDDGGAEFVMKFEHSKDLLSDLLKWARGVMMGGDNPVPAATTTQNDAEDPVATQTQNLLSTAIGEKTPIFVHRVSMGLDKAIKPRYFKIDIEIAMPLGDSSQAPFLATLEWKRGRFELSAYLWPEDLYGAPLNLHPFYEETEMSTPKSPNAVFRIPIKTLLHLPAETKMPPGIPDTISVAEVIIGWQSEEEMLSAFMATEVSCKPLPTAPTAASEEDSNAPALRLESVELQVDLDWLPKTSKADVSIHISASLTLSMPDSFRYSTDSAATRRITPITFSMKYQYEDQRSLWEAQASVYSINLGNLYQLFAGDGSNHAVLELMGSIYIPYARIRHVYDTINGNEIYIVGKISLGAPNSASFRRLNNDVEPNPSVELDLSYYHTKTKGWEFTAKVSSGNKDGNIKIIDILKTLVPNPSELPEFVQSLEVPRSKLSAKIVCSKTKDYHVVFAFEIEIGDILLSFAQIRSAKTALAVAMGNDASIKDNDPGPGRLLRVALTKFPAVPAMPVIGAVSQPFDQLGIAWTSRDITPEEIKLLNDSVFTKTPLMSRASKSPGGLEPLQKGFHFQVALLENGRQRLLIDHVVGKKKQQKDPQPKQEIQADAGGANASKTIAPVSKSFGPLSVSNIGLSITGKNMSTVEVSVDATLTLGPMSVSLLGLSFDIDLSRVKGLQDLGNLSITPSIKGMAVEFNKPPTRLAGMFLTFDDEDQSGFLGAIAVSVAAWSAIAGGMYAEAKSLDRTKSVFVFGILRGTIFSIGAVDVNGLTGGFGYNSALRLPATSQIAQFPFIAMNSSTAPQPKLATQMQSLRASSGDGQGTGWITMVRDEKWLVAGIGFKAFQTVDAQVVLALSLSEQPKFAVLAQASAVFPKSLPVTGDDPLEHALLVIDIVMRAEVDFFHGTIICGGELTPRSFILSRSCQLTGGFALAFFIVGSPHEGDFCFSVGGYADGFTPPSHYPPAPPRVGIAWRYDKDLSITGQAYFAVTPQAVMGGGRLDAVLDKGWLYVSFSAWANFFMHLHPFSFMVDIGITLIASLKIKILITVEFGPMEFSARLSLWGPPVAGTAFLQLWIRNVTVAFGPAKSSPPPLKWSEFVRLIKNLPANKDSAIKSKEEEEVPNHILSIMEGLVPVDQSQKQPAQTTTDKTNTDAVTLSKVVRTPIRSTAISFSVQTRVPILSDSVSNETYDSPPLHTRPMQLSSPIVKSHLNVTLNWHSPSSSLEPMPLDVIARITKPLAPSLFGQPTGSTASAATAREEMITHTIGLEIQVREKPRPSQEIPVVDMRAFNSTDVGKSETYVISGAGTKTLEACGVTKGAPELDETPNAGTKGFRGLTMHTASRRGAGEKAGMDVGVVEVWERWRKRMMVN